MRWRWPPESCDGIPVGEAFELHELQQLRDALLDLVLRPLADLRPNAMLSCDRHVLERGVVLEDEADLPILRRLPGHVRRRR